LSGLKHLVDCGLGIVAAEASVLGSPVFLLRRMHIFDAAFPVVESEVSHVQFAGKRMLRVIIGFVYFRFPSMPA
jgi:hypothetical protein